MVLCCHIVLLLSLAAVAADRTDEFRTWARRHGKVYGTQEEEGRRYSVWCANMDLIASTNAAGLGFVVAPNWFADMTAEEVNGWVGPDAAVGDLPEPNGRATPREGSIDWRDRGVVTSVKRQGDCMSCWAFSAAGVVESALALDGGNLVDLSPQYLLDCVTDDGNRKCNGGGVAPALQHVRTVGGMPTARDYPYLANGTRPCPETLGEDCRFLLSYDRVLPAGSEDALAGAIFSRGPVSVSFDAVLPTFHFYSGGVYSDPSCRNWGFNHRALAVGYTDEYFIVKNSWGTTWGDDGYFLLARRGNNTCAIATDSYSAVVAAEHACSGHGATSCAVSLRPIG